jgi:hypothetical protein
MCTTEVPLALFCIQIKKIHSTVQDAKIHISEPRFSKDISIVMLIADFHYAPNDIRHHYLPRKTSITEGLSVPPQSLWKHHRNYAHKWSLYKRLPWETFFICQQVPCMDNGLVCSQVLYFERLGLRSLPGAASTRSRSKQAQIARDFKVTCSNKNRTLYKPLFLLNLLVSAPLDELNIHYQLLQYFLSYHPKNKKKQQFN